MTTQKNMEIPKGYHAATSEERKCLPTGTLVWSGWQSSWVPTVFVGDKSPFEGDTLICPDTITPSHYAAPVTPWDLQRHMKSSGNAFVDARRTDAIEYCFRMKDCLLDDLKKARHCLDEAIKVMEQENK